MKHTRVINVRYTVNGLNFDAAIDPDWQLHSYPEDLVPENFIPIEIYCINKPDWGIKMIYQDKEIAKCGNPVNPQQDEEKYRMMYNHTYFSCCNFDNIIEETKKWLEWIGYEE